MAQLILVRHGQTDWCKEKRVRGTLDIPLNNEGMEEARQVSAELSTHKIDHVYSGPAACCFSTACVVATPHNVKVKKVDELNELCHGVWQGLLVKDIKKRYRKHYNIWKASPTAGRPPKGESIRDAYDRAISAVRKLVDKHKGENICVVSGDITLFLIKCHINNMDLEEIWKFIPEKTWWEALEI